MQGSRDTNKDCKEVVTKPRNKKRFAVNQKKKAATNSIERKTTKKMEETYIARK